LIAAAAAAGRVRLEDILGEPPPLAALPQGRLARTLPLYVSIPMRAALATFLLAGLATNWTEALILASVLVLVIVARGVITRTPSVAREVTRVPYPARLAATGGASFLLGCLIMRGTLESAPGFQPLIYALGASLLVSAVLLPTTSTPTPNERRRFE